VLRGLISAQALITGPASVKERFVDTVARLANGRTLPRDFKPTKVIYAILMENGKHFTPDTLFPFSHATLAPPSHKAHESVDVGRDRCRREAALF
jgi:hypothetical protein